MSKPNLNYKNKRTINCVKQIRDIGNRFLTVIEANI